ncbi:MAG: MlrC C-terminal domain-containing protein [Deinococcota bacterium]
MTQRWPQDGDALTMHCGDAVSLHVNGIDIVVNSKRQQVFSPDVFTELGIVPQDKRLLIVKSIQHFYAGFAPIASEIIYMAAPGAVAPIMEDIPYQHVDLHKFPWVDDPFAQN